MRIFFDNFHEGGKYTAQIASHQAGLIREGKITDQNSVSVSYLQTDSLNIDISSGSGIINERANIFQIKCTFCGVNNHSVDNFFLNIINNKDKSHTDVVWTDN